MLEKKYSKPWYVVLFPEEDSISLVPNTWYVEQTEECFWPSEKEKTKIDKLIKNRHVPNEDWKPFKASILGKYSKYEK